MPQLHFYVPDAVATELRERARALGLPLSRYLAQVVRRETAGGWPDSYFDDVVGAWKGKPIERPDQGEFETRENL